MIYFTCRLGHGTDGLTSPPKDSWWFIGAQSGGGMTARQDLGWGLIAKDVALRLMWCHWHAGLFYITWYTGAHNPGGSMAYTNVWHLARWPLILVALWLNYWSITRAVTHPTPDLARPCLTSVTIRHWVKQLRQPTIIETDSAVIRVPCILEHVWYESFSIKISNLEKIMQIR